MRTTARLVLVLGLVCCVGCSRPRRVKHTPFFLGHDARAHLRSVAEAEGHEVRGGGGGHAIGGSTGEKSFHVLIEGDASIRDALMGQYKDYVESELSKSGVSINGRGTCGKISGFDFNYHKSGVTGIVRVNAVVGSDGYIEVDVFVYEHR